MGIRSYQFTGTKKFKGDDLEVLEEGVISEEPVTLMVNGTPWLDFMCSPQELKELGVGFLYNEEIINSIDDILLVDTCPRNQCIDIWLKKDISMPDGWRLTSGCAGGITFVKSSYPVRKTESKLGLTPYQVRSLVKKLFDQQKLYKKVRGVHASALSDGEDLLIVCEDIGRHNSIDKIAGKYLLEKFDILQKVLLSSGRISSEMAQKSYRLGADILISRTSPTSMSVKFAEEVGMTLIGYARGRQFTVYTHPQRILDPEIT